MKNSGNAISPIKVVLRVRPIAEHESPHSIITKVDAQTIRLQDSKTFRFDFCHVPLDSQNIDTDQRAFYQSIGPSMLQSCLKGENTAVLAYGMTGTGKSHSIFGCKDAPGLVPRLGHDIISELIDKAEPGWTLDVQFGEIGDSKHVRDLIPQFAIYDSSTSDIDYSHSTASRSKRSISLYATQTQAIRERPNSEKTTRVPVKTAEDLIKIIQSGLKLRTQAETRLNEKSSRSHAILTISLNFTLSETGHHFSNRLCIVDLAGCERQRSAKTTGDRLREGCHINRSLSALSLVIKALAENSDLEKKGSAHRVHVPYRDNHLTYLLKDYLGGNASTTMLITVSPTVSHLDETLSTLRYATRAMSVVNRPTANLCISDPLETIRELREEVERLRALLQFKNSQPSGLMHDINIVDKEHVFQQPEDLESTAAILESEKVPQLVTFSEGYPRRLHVTKLRYGKTCIGSDPSSQDVVFYSEFIEPSHAIVERCADGSVWIEPACFLSTRETQKQTVPKVYLDGLRITSKARLISGVRILLGRSHVMTFLKQSDSTEMKSTTPATSNITTPSSVMSTPPSPRVSKPPYSIEPINVQRLYSHHSSRVGIEIPNVETIHKEGSGAVSYMYPIFIQFYDNFQQQVTDSWVVRKRYDDVFQFYEQIKSWLPPNLLKLFPLVSAWQSFVQFRQHGLMSPEEQERLRCRLEMFLKGYVAWVSSRLPSDGFQSREQVEERVPLFRTSGAFE